MSTFAEFRTAEEEGPGRSLARKWGQTHPEAWAQARAAFAEPNPPPIRMMFRWLRRDFDYPYSEVTLRSALMAQ